MSSFIEDDMISYNMNIVIYRESKIYEYIARVFFYNTVRPVHLWIMKPTFKQSYEYSMNCSGVNSFTKLHIPQDLTVYYTNLMFC